LDFESGWLNRFWLQPSYARSVQAIVSTTPPSTRKAAPVVADACGDAA
jgi:hypothetical protein